MYTAKIETADGLMLTLTGAEADYQVVSIAGLDPPKAQINTSTIVGLDGAVFNSSKLATRNIVLTVKINGNVEVNRQNLYNYFRTKDKCTFYYSNDNRDVFIDGYVESVECNLFTNSEMAQISIICPYPYFKSVAEISTDLTSVFDLFTFPFSINEGEPIAFSTYEASRVTNVYNTSESETGVIIQIDFESAVNEVEIKNTTTGDDMILNYSFRAGDRVTINTNKGQKSIALMRNGVYINLFPALERGSTFFQLAVGDNLFGYLIDDGANNQNVNVVVTHYATFRGV